MKKLLLCGSICCLVTASGLIVNAETPVAVDRQTKIQIASATTKPQLELLDAGNEPRQELRFQPQVNAKQTAILTINMDTNVSMAGQMQPKVDLPATAIVIDTVVTKVDPNGDIHLKLSYSDVKVMNSATVSPQIMETLRSQMKKMIGTSGSFILNDRGQVKAGNYVFPKGIDPNMKQVMEQTSNSLDEASMPLPDEALGIGAKWRVTSSPYVGGLLGGMKVTQTTTYELVNLKDGIATLNVWVKQHATAQKINRLGMPAGSTITLQSFDAEGDGRMMGSLNQLFPLRSNLIMRSNSLMDIQPAGKAATTMDTKMTVKLNIQSK